MEELGRKKLDSLVLSWRYCLMIVKTLLHHSFKKFFRPECKNQLHFSFLFGSPVRAAWYQLEDILTDSMFTRERARGCNYCNWLSYRIDYSPKTWDSTVGFFSTKYIVSMHSTGFRLLKKWLSNRLLIDVLILILNRRKRMQTVRMIILRSWMVRMEPLT